MRPLRNGNGDRSCRESWRTSGRRSSRDLKVRMPFPSTAALPHWLPVLPSPELPITSSQPLRDHPHLPSQTDDASHETQEPESFSAWSDRMAREHAQKHQQQRREAEGACRPPRAEGSGHSWRQQEEEQLTALSSGHIGVGTQARAKSWKDSATCPGLTRVTEPPRKPGQQTGLPADSQLVPCGPWRPP